ncbi:FAD-dependent thymidylate synthase [Corynebacterium ciconiae]|uniref:FAD-dependent thymidylate synthase n=1 Tax=Corynebacterium ciconiae TaxID=227319 RepID=UPI003F4DAB5E
MRRDPEATDAEHLAEFAGRACYQSFHKPNPATRKNADYLQRTLFEQHHWSIAEHATATLYFTGVSRAFTHELIRHRHLSYSQLSQRYVDEAEASPVIPPAVSGLEPYIGDDKEPFTDGLYCSLTEAMQDWAREARRSYKILVERLLEEGFPRKQAREAARAVLPNMTETRIVVTGNLRAWHDVIQRRTAPDADAEMQHVMELAREALQPVAPVIFTKEQQ